MLTPQYIHLKPTYTPQNVEVEGPFAAVVVIDTMVSSDWRHTVSEWLVAKGCLYMMAHGDDCSLWDESVDTANLEAFDWSFKDIPDDKIVTTTWHEDESLEEVYYFAITCALPFSPLIKNIVILDIADEFREHEMLTLYETVQDEVNTEGNTISTIGKAKIVRPKNELYEFLGMIAIIIGSIAIITFIDLDVFKTLTLKIVGLGN